MKFHILFLLLFLAGSSFAQKPIETEAKGSGLTKNDALQDALRNAVSQGAGVAILSETKVENYMIVSDAIASNTKGYIKSYSVIKEIPFPDRFEVTIKATVTTETMGADFYLLSKQIGGVRFLTMVDTKETDLKAIENLNIAANKINQLLSEKGCRYVDKSRFETLKKEAIGLMETTNTGKTTNYAQQLGLVADAQFLIILSDFKSVNSPGAFDISRGAKVSFSAKIIDNCTGEGLGTIVMTSPKSSKTASDAISIAVESKFDKLFQTFTGYIGSWLNNGTPFELRFYQVGTFRDFRTFRKKLKDDNSFGGEMEVTTVLNYSKLNCTFKKKADDLADKVLDISDEIPTFKDKNLDVKFIYGRQISFAPQNYIIPSLPKEQPKLEDKEIKSTINR